VAPRARWCVHECRALRDKDTSRQVTGHWAGSRTTRWKDGCDEGKPCFCWINEGSQGFLRRSVAIWWADGGRDDHFLASKIAGRSSFWALLCPLHFSSVLDLGRVCEQQHSGRDRSRICSPTSVVDQAMAVGRTHRHPLSQVRLCTASELDDGPGPRRGKLH
jgi:hypothetical protein